MNLRVCICLSVCVYKMNAKNSTGNAYMRYLCPSTCRRFIALTFLFKSFFKLITYSLLHKLLFHTHFIAHTQHTRTHLCAHISNFFPFVLPVSPI